MGLRGIIFDLDGTLLDSMPMWHELDRRFLSEYGIEAPPDISDIVKNMTIEQSSAYYAERFRLPVTAEQVADRIEQLAVDAYRYDLQLKNGAEALLSELHRRGIPCAIASVTYPKLLDAVLERLQIKSYFQTVMTPPEGANGKHTPVFYNAVLAEMGLKACETVVVEDALYAAETAQKMGFFTVGMKDDLAKEEWCGLEEICRLTIHDWTALNHAEFLNLFA